jgi:iron complex outermembrane receptor protein
MMKRSMTVAMLAGTAIGLSVPAWAQDAATTASATTDKPQPELPIGDIVVTAQRRSQRLQDVPIAVSVVAGADLERSNLRSLQDVTERLPNVKIVSGTNADALNIRGVGSGQNAGFEQSVGTFVDGVYRGRSRATRAALFDLERVEVLKGPQTTFFGNNAIAGALNITTKKPGDQLEYNATALYGEDGEFNLEGGVSTPLTDTLSVRVAGRYSGINGYVYNSTLTEDSGRMRDYLGRASIRFEPSATVRSDLRFDIGRNRNRNAFAGELVGCPPPAGYPPAAAQGNVCGLALAFNPGLDDRFNNRAVGEDSFFNYDFKEVAWTNSIGLGRHTLTTITSYFDHDTRMLLQLIPVPYLPSNVGLPFVNGGLLPTANYEKYHSFSQEVRLQSPTGGTFEYMIGAYYSHTYLNAINHTGFFIVPFALIPGAPSEILPTDGVSGTPTLRETDNNYSVFGSLTWHPIEPLKVNLGLRYMTVTKDATRSLIFGRGADRALGLENFRPYTLPTQAFIAAVLGGNQANYAQPKRTDDAVMPSVNVQYTLAPDIMTYASYTRGFKAGGFDASSTGTTFDPEFVNAYEVGLKSQFFDRRLTLNLAGFWSEYRDLQETTIKFVGSGQAQTIISVVANAGKARVRGAEFNARLRVSDVLTLTGDVGYLDATYQDFPNGSCTILQNTQTPNCVQDLSGKRRAFSPKWSGNLRASFAVPVGGLVATADPGLYFTSRYFQSATADPLLVQKGYAKVDLRLGVGPADKRWELAVVGKNLFDKRTAYLREAVPTSPGTVNFYGDRPRSVAVQISIRN